MSTLLHDRYSILPDGTIYNVVTGKIMKQTYSMSRSGKRYATLRVTVNYKKYSYHVHRLVALHYCNHEQWLVLGRFNEVNHIDRNTLNNIWTNLEIVTSSENQKHWRKQGEE